MLRAYDQSLADCEEFAATFANTCTDGYVSDSDILDQSGDEVSTLTCTGTYDTWCVGEEMSVDNPATSSCTYDSFMCVTCEEQSDGEVRLRY